MATEKQRLYAHLYHQRRKNDPAYRQRRFATKQRWHQANPERTLLHRRKTYRKHLDKIKAASRRYYQENREHLYRKHLEWRKNHPEKIYQYGVKFRKTHQDYLQQKRITQKHKDCVRIKNARYRKEYPEKVKAHYLANYAAKKNRIGVYDKCAQCGQSKKIEKHHQDYSKPLEVIFLCKQCHCDVHRLRP